MTSGVALRPLALFFYDLIEHLCHLGSATHVVECCLSQLSSPLSHGPRLVGMVAHEVDGTFPSLHIAIVDRYAAACGVDVDRNLWVWLQIMGRPMAIASTTVVRPTVYFVSWQQIATHSARATIRLSS